MKKEWRTLTAVVVVALASAVAWSGYRFLEASTPVKGAVVSTVGKNALIFFRVGDGSGRVDMVGLTAKNLDMGGRPVARLLKAYPAWRVREAKAGEIVLSPRPGADAVSLGIDNGFVAIFFGKAGRGPVQEVTGIPVASLMRQDRARLTKGIPVKSLARAWQLLEGIEG